MAYVNDIEKKLGAGAISYNVRAEMNDWRTAVVSGHKGLIEYGTEKLRFKVKGGCLIISGRELEMVSLSPDEAYVRGEIRAIKRNDED